MTLLTHVRFLGHGSTKSIPSSRLHQLSPAVVTSWEGGQWALGEEHETIRSHEPLRRTRPAVVSTCFAPSSKMFPTFSNFFKVTFEGSEVTLNRLK